MTKAIAIGLAMAFAVVLVGCGSGGDSNSAELISLRAAVDELEAKLESSAGGNSAPAAADGDVLRRLERIEGELAALRNPGPGKDATDGRIDALAREIEAIKARLEAKPESGEAAANTPPADSEREAGLARQIEEARRLLGEKLPLLMVSPGDESLLGDVVDLLWGAEKADRDAAIEKLEQAVKENPESVEHRIALASVLQTRFGDLKNPMEQGALAGRVKGQISAALKLDPDHYRAVQMLALLKSQYPSFTPEFKEAKADLDRALELQAKLGWRDEFASIYEAYCRWYRMQKEYDKALEIIQQGLDKSPRHEGMLAQKKQAEKEKAEAAGG